MSTSVAETRAENGDSEKVSAGDNKSDSILGAETNGTIEGGVESSLSVKTSKEPNTAEKPEQDLNAEEKLKSPEDLTPTQTDNNLNNKGSSEAKNGQKSSNDVEQPEKQAPTTTESEIEKPKAGLTSEELKNDQKIEEKKVIEEGKKEADEKKNDEELKEIDDKTEVEEDMGVGVMKDEQEKKEKEETFEAGKDAGKQGLPKWMVQSANAPPSPSPELAEKTDGKQDETAAPIKRRGRGRRSMAEKAAEAKQKQINEGEEGQSEEALSPRPRRSTRSRVDYANPDPMTVVAEADDEEPGGGAKRITRNAPGRKPIVGRGRKRKVTTSDDEDGGHEYEDDDDEDYGSKKRVAKKRSTAGSAVGTPASGGIMKRGRGRPAASVGKNSSAKGRAARGGFTTKRMSKHDKDSDEEHSEVVYDDGESDKDPTTEDDSGDEKQQQTKSVAPVVGSKVTTPVKAPPKKRGRPAGARQQKQVSDGKRRDTDSNDDG